MEEQTGSLYQSTPASDAPSTLPDPRAHSASPASCSSSSHLSSSATSTLASSSTLRFPEPEGSHLLAHWVTSSSAAPTDNTDTANIMSPPSISDESSSLADSAYELISSTDGESQDGRATASLADSLELYPRTDDVQSLSGNDTAYDENSTSEDEEDDNDEDNHGHDHHGTHSQNTPSHSYLVNDGAGHDKDHGDRRPSQSDSIQYAEDALDNPSTQSFSTIDYDSSASVGLAGQTPLVQSIEFSETDVCLEKVSVKHTIREFDELESAAIALTMDMTDPPKRLAATIRQTMSHHYLSTREPLRVLYVGSDAAYNDITYKISSAILASAPPSRPDRPSDHGSTTASIYNIIPISAFGSTKVPEIDEIQLMGVSEYYIKVERCVQADEIVYEGEAFPNDTVYSLTLDSEKTHLSVFSPSGSVVRPRWTLPHVAVFYVSGSDDERAETTRSAAWEFMTRHAVPSIFISHKQDFSRHASMGRWQDFVDQAAVHLCVESRDSERSAVPERLPIDLASFLNIDARQMNRNLAYLTGLHALQDEGKDHVSHDTGKYTISGGMCRAVNCLREGTSPFPNLSQAMGEVRHHLGVDGWTAMIVAAISGLVWMSIVFYVPFLSPWALTSIYSSATTAGTASSASLTSPVPFPGTSATGAAVITSTCSVPTLTPTVTISLTSTKTVKLRISETSSSTLHFGGFLTDQASHQSGARRADSKIKSTGCSIQVHSNHEILVKVPSGTKAKWLAKGAIDIDVWRGRELLKSKLWTTDEGIIIEINRKDAYGVMNVSIVTTRWPKINETFAVDFGKPGMSQLLDVGANLFRDSAQVLVSKGRDVALYAEKAISDYADGAALPWSAQEMVDGASGVASSAAASVVEGVKHVGQLAINMTEGAAHGVGDQLRGSTSISINKMMRDAQAVLVQAKQRLQLPEQFRDEMELVILRQQIQARLWWLRLWGKTTEHADYEAKAARFLREKEKEAKAKTGCVRSAEKKKWLDKCQSAKFYWSRGSEPCLGKEPAGRWTMRALP